MKSKLLFSLLLISGITYSQVTTVLSPSKDNSIFSENTNSNGQGSLFSGAISNGNSRRALLAFDLSSIPAGAVITDVSLELTITRSRSSNTPYTLHRLTTDWGEGASLATGQGGLGAPAQAPDATWQDAMLGTVTWSTAGGDFVSTSSSTTPISSNDVTALFTGTDLVDDVQDWVDGVNSNFGWILIGDESGSRNASRFDSREGTAPPQLTITYNDTASVLQISFNEMVTVSPNPARDFLQIDITQNTHPINFEIYDLLGHRVFEEHRAANSSYHLNFDLPSGVYIIKVASIQGRVSRKFMVR